MKFLYILLPLLINVIQANKYKVTVFTGSVKYAGTDAWVRITLISKTGKCGPKVIDNKKNNFERNDVDNFEIECPDLGRIDKIIVQQDNSGRYPGWFLDKVLVKSKCGAVFIFPCNTWLDKDPKYGLKRTLAVKEEKYKVIVYTSDVKWAGTDANVKIQLIGENGKCGFTNIDNQENNFERNKVDTFTINCLALGKLSKIKIGEDNTGINPNWRLNKVVIVGSGQKYTFNCDAWFVKDNQLKTLTAA